MKRSLFHTAVLLTAVILVFLCACGKTDTDAAGEYSGGSPWIASIIPENAASASETALRDDFYLAVNLPWLQDNPIRPGNMREIYLTSFVDELNVRLERLLTDPAVSGSHEAQLVRTFYATFLDWDARDAAGAAPLKPYLEAIEQAASADDVLELFCDELTDFADFFPWISSADPSDASQKVLLVASPPVFLNDKADYADLENMDEYVRLVYDCKESVVETVLVKCGYAPEEALSIYEGAIRFEQLFSRYCYTLEESSLVETRGAINTQIYSAQELERFGRFSVISRVAAKLGYPENARYLLYEKADYFENFDKIVCDDNLTLMKDYLIAHTAAASCKALDRECFYAAVDAENAIQGAVGYKDETEYAITAVSDWLGWPLSRLYCDEYVTEQEKQSLRGVIDDVINEYKVMLMEEEFLSAETKAGAVRKLDNMAVRCLYPDEWYDYSGLELSGAYLDMKAQSMAFETHKAAEEFSEPVNREHFDSTPITANAYYALDTNSILILPGLVGNVLYNSDMPLEEVYAKVGVIIGHEISHAFDPTGAGYDEIGNYKSWWTEDDEKAFEALSRKIVDYYDGVVVWDGLSCNGEICKGEACADMAGMKVMLRLAAAQEDFDYDLFFRSFAQLWAANYAPTFVQYSAMYDTHPLPYLRVNVVLAQFDEFCETYGIKKGDGMYIAPEDRIKIW